MSKKAPRRPAERDHEQRAVREALRTRPKEPLPRGLVSRLRGRLAAEPSPRQPGQRSKKR